MKFAMFTPGLQSSAIGRVASMVTRELAAVGHEVTVVRTEDRELLDRPEHDFGSHVVGWLDTAPVETLLREADLVVHHIGDHYPYHRGGLEWLARVPGVVCLHDFFLGHLFRGWAEHRRDDAVSVLRSLYGDGIADTYFDIPASAFIDATCDAAPLSEWVVRQASGVVTHSSWGLPRVLAACPGPVRVVPLAYAPPAPVATAPGGSGEFKVLTVGHVNSNKRAESVIRAIGDSPRLRDSTTYRLVGAVHPDVAARLNEAARSAGVRLVVSGEATDAELASALADADVVCCLRWPTLEAASASTIEAMLCGKAVVVEDTGFYRELPDDCVAKVRPEREVPDLRTRLERLADDPHARRRMGEHAAEWARATFTAANYARHLAEIAADCRRSEPVVGVVEQAVQQLDAWGDVSHFITLPQTIEPLRLFEAAGAGPARATTA